MAKKWFIGISAIALFATLSFGVSSTPASTTAAVASTASSSAKWWQSAVFYEIFPLSFLDTTADGKGDLNGITAKLDYLKSLGITAIWLTPINAHQPDAYHGYAVDDYYTVDPILGTMEDFQKLLSEAHSRGIKIVMDLVMNHTSKFNPWFIASANNDPAYKDWYIWLPSDPGGWANASGNTQMPAWNRLDNSQYKRNGQVYYAAFNMTIPDLNHNNPAVRAEFRKIAKFWLDKGVDGFRIDAARYLIEAGPGGSGHELDTPETITYLNDYAAYVKSINPNAYVIAEVFAGLDITAKYYRAGGLDAVFCFDLGDNTGAIKGTFATGKTSSYYQQVQKLASIAAGGVPSTFFSHFFSNHDSGRLPENLREPDKIKAAAVSMFAAPGGAPYIYYGDEIGEREGYNLIGDAAKRNPMWWSNTSNAGFTARSGAWVKRMKIEFYTNCNVAMQINDPQSVWSLFKQLIALRESQPVLQTGSYEYINMDLTKMKYTDDRSATIDKNPLISFVRVLGNQAAVVLVNPGKHPIQFKQDVASPFIQAHKNNLKVVASLYSKDLTRPLPDNIANKILSGTFDMTLQGRDFVVLIVETR